MTVTQVKMLRALELLLDDDELEILESRIALTISEGKTRAMSSRLANAKHLERNGRRLRGLRRAFAAQAERRYALAIASANRPALLGILKGVRP